MRSAIWKLSALAAVIGLGLVAVAMQQKGLGLSAAKPGEKPAANASIEVAPKISKPSDGKLAEAKPADTDPFGAESTDETSDSPPDQVQPLDGGSDNPVSLASTEANDQLDEADFNAPVTKPRIKSRALNFKDQLDNDNPSGVEVAQVEDLSATGQRTRSRTENSQSDQGIDPSEMEGTTPGDHEPSQLTDDPDPFEKRRQAILRGTKNRSRPNINDVDVETVQNPGESARDPANPFDQGSETDTESVPAVPVPGTRPRGKLIADGEPIAAEPLDSAISDTANESQFEQTEASPAGYRAETEATGSRTQASANPRPVIAGEDGFQDRVVPAPPVAGVSAAPAAKGGTAGRRPQIVPDDDAGESTGATPPTAPRSSNGIQTIPKINRESSVGTNSLMPPVVAKSGRVRPNPFAEEGDMGGGLGDRPAAPNSAGKGLNRVETTPAEQTPDSESNNRPALTGTPEAAASRSIETEVIAVPPRLSASANPPARGATYGGRGRVTIEKMAPPTAYVGQPLIYQIVVRNLGNGAAQQVVVEDILPEGVTIQGSIPQGELTGRKLAWRIGALSAGEERKISVKVVPGAAGAIGSSATVKFVADQMYASADGAESANLPTTTAPRTAPRTTSGTNPRTGNGVQLEMQSPPQIGMGQTFEVRFQITNRTAQPLNDVLVRNMLSSSLRHESRVQDLEYRVGTLAAGETRDMPLTLTAKQTGRAVSRVIVMTGNERVLHSDEFSLEVVGGQGLPPAAASPATPNLSLDVVPPVDPVRVGGRLVYEIRLINRGTVPARQSAVRLGVPRELKLVDAGPINYRQEGADLVFDAIPILEAGQQAMLKAEFIAQSPGETFLKVQFVGSHMKRPLSREEGLIIGGQ